MEWWLKILGHKCDWSENSEKVGMKWKRWLVSSTIWNVAKVGGGQKERNASRARSTMCTEYFWGPLYKLNW